ncbi:uncharacterized protein [Diabrotica undecimpunctata]|uniref:uncharacterized protein n=1 Tax=Diabrotica undecimpunctata TaxID=50387 RepID=UPI003B63AB3B
MQFDKRLSWRNHIQTTKANCLKRINIIKSLAHYHWGSEEEVLLRIYQALIRSKLDYGSILYMSACKSLLNSLNVVQNTSLRICLGAFRSSPSESIHVEAYEPPLTYRRQRLLLNYFAKVSANPSNPAAKLVARHTVIKPTEKLRSVYPFDRKLHQLINNTDFSHMTPICIPHTPPWTRKQPSFNISLCRYDKKETPISMFRQEFNKMIDMEKFDTILYTDASKDEHGTSCAVTTTNETIASFRLPTICSIHTVELYGINKALEVTPKSSKRIAICTDSLSSIHSLKTLRSQHPIVNKVHAHCHQLLTSGTSVSIIWVPSHVGVIGNEKADQAEKEANCPDHPVERIQLHQDLKYLFRQSVLENWQDQWSRSTSKLHQIQPIIRLLQIPIQKRRDKAIIRRIRIGHTRLTHGYLMSSGNPPVCERCNNTRLSIQHILLECNEGSTSNPKDDAPICIICDKSIQAKEKFREVKQKGLQYRSS